MGIINKKLLPMGARIKVLVVDDSVVIRRLVTHALEEDRSLELVGAASNGSIALQRIPEFSPDVVTLDIEMPEMDGLEMLRCLRRDYPRIRVIMFSTLTERGAEITLEALTLGAHDYVTKASNAGSLDRSLIRLRDELIPKIRQFFQLPGAAVDDSRVGFRSLPVPVFRSDPKTLQGPRPQIVVIGISTGGPVALHRIMPALPADFPLPVMVVQHMPPMFTRLLAERLDKTCPLSVTEAATGDRVEAGRVFIAPGDFHMKLAPAGTHTAVCLDQSPPLNSCRPSVDALFASAAQTYGGAVIAAILTGMGQDGLLGVRLLKNRGASILAQDEASSVVWGMPKAIVEANLVDLVLPLDEIIPEIMRRAVTR